MSSDPGDVTPLATWMREKRVKLRELAERTGITEWTLGRIRSGRARPSLENALRIERETLAIETQLGLAEPRGVLARDWHPEVTSNAVVG